MTLPRSGYLVAGATLVLPLLWPVALVIGIVLLVRGARRAGVITLILGTLVLPAIGATLWSSYVVKSYRNPAESMSPTLKSGERFLILKLDKSPEVGDIVVFNPPTGAETRQCGVVPPELAMCPRAPGGRDRVAFVKRVVALGGDRIAMRDGKMIRNGKEDEYGQVSECSAGCDFPTEITVPKGQMFVLGDNRGASDDSRFLGAYP